MMQSVSSPNWTRLSVIALLAISGLAVARTLFCFLMPEAIGGWSILDPNSDMLILAFPFVTLGYYAFIIKKRLALGMLILIPGLYLLGGISTLKVQMDVFHYGRNYPLIDNSLARIDSLLFFDWASYFNWTMRHSLYLTVISAAYQSIWAQPVLLCAIFASNRKVLSYFSFQLAMPLSFALTCIVAAFLPALGAYQFHSASIVDHANITLEFTDQMTKPMLWLRQDELPDAMPYFRDLRVITFPSWHAAAAMVFVMSAWPMYRLRYIVICLNVLMLLGTPVQGSHFLIDIIAGAFVGLASFMASKYVLQYAAVDRKGHDKQRRPAQSGTPSPAALIGPLPQRPA